MINLAIKDGLMIPNRSDIIPITFQAAVSNINFIQNQVLFESATKKSKFNIIEIFKQIIEKIIGVIKDFINKIRKYTTPKIDFITKNKKTILEFDETNPAYNVKVNIPINLLDSQYTIVDFNKILNDWTGKAYLAIKSNVSQFDLYRNNSTTIAYSILSDFTGAKHIKISENSMITLLYGHSKIQKIGDLNINKLYDRFIELHKNINTLESIQQNLTEVSIRTQSDLEKQQRNLLNNQNIEQKVSNDTLRYAIAIYQGVLIALDFYIKSQIKIYTLMYSILEKIINSTTGNKERG